METDPNHEIAELRARIQRLEDREELVALVARYGRAVDDRDWESLADQYTPDAVFDSAAGRSVGADAIIEYYKERTDAERLFRYCDRRSADTEFFIRKALGWALRQYARTDPDAVRSYVAANADHLSGLTKREATKHL